MLAHIGDPDMGYREFGSPRSETRARRDWSLLDSAAGGKGGEPVDIPHAPSRVSAPLVSPRSPAYVGWGLLPTPAVRVDDGESGVQGKSVDVRVDVSGSANIQKKIVVNNH